MKSHVTGCSAACNREGAAAVLRVSLSMRLQGATSCHNLDTAAGACVCHHATLTAERQRRSLTPAAMHTAWQAAETQRADQQHVLKHTCMLARRDALRGRRHTSSTAPRLFAADNSSRSMPSAVWAAHTPSKQHWGSEVVAGSAVGCVEGANEAENSSEWCCWDVIWFELSWAKAGLGGR